MICNTNDANEIAYIYNGWPDEFSGDLSILRHIKFRREDYVESISDFDSLKTENFNIKTRSDFFIWGKKELWKVLIDIRKDIKEIEAWLDTQDPDCLEIGQQLIKNFDTSFKSPANEMYHGDYQSEIPFVEHYKCDDIIPELNQILGSLDFNLKKVNIEQTKSIHQIMFTLILKSYLGDILQFFNDEYGGFHLGSVWVRIHPPQKTKKESPLQKKTIAWIFLVLTKDDVNKNKLERNVLFKFLVELTGYKTWGKEYKNTTVKTERKLKTEINKNLKGESRSEFIDFISSCNEAPPPSPSIDFSSISNRSMYTVATVLIGMEAFILADVEVYKKFKSTFKIDNDFDSTNDDTCTQLSEYLAQIKSILG